MDQARTVLREVKVLKEMASQRETMSGPLHIGLIPTIGPVPAAASHSDAASDLPEAEMYLHEAQTHQLLAQLDSGKARLRHLTLVKESGPLSECRCSMSR